MFDMPPHPYGLIHLVSLMLVLCAGIVSAMWAVRHDRDLIEKVIGAAGIVLIVAEIAKQIFCTVIVGHGVYPLHIIPLELCSTVMYVAAAVPYVSEKIRMTCCAYLATFGMVGAIAALAFPMGMLNMYVFLVTHSFAYHGMMIVIGVLSAVALLRCENEIKVFKRTIPIFGFFALAAETANSIAHWTSGGNLNTNLFYISPWVECTQPVFSTISAMFGPTVEIVVYLSVIIAISYIFYTILILTWKRMQTK